MAPITTMASAVYSPLLRAFCGLPPSLPCTMNVPITEATIPRADKIAGKIAAFAVSSVIAPKEPARPRVIAEIREPA